MRSAWAEGGRLVPYLWLSSVVSGQRVLDAGCGLGQGASVLARAGAGEVVGVDDRDALLKVAAQDVAPGVVLQKAGLAQLPFDDASFDVVVAVDLAGREEGYRPVTRELLRVGKPAGLLLISSCDPVAADEVRTLLEQHRRHVVLWRVYDLVTCAILDDESADAADASVLPKSAVRKAGGCEPGTESHVVVLGSDAALDLPGPEVLVTSTRDARGWLRHADEQEHQLDALRARVRDLEAQLGERDQLRGELRAAEQALAVRISTYEAAVQDASLQTAEAYRRTVSWRVTSPLRTSGQRVKRVMRRALRVAR
ncbi:MAG: class I SAM-dependent methyltransferase [Candidatus Dormibacteraeota bacterium]|nr:class I SAM-dependent methyltransferase [Candidatus Dormibacteraeota bacterium]